MPVDWIWPAQVTVPDVYSVMASGSAKRCTISNAVGDIADPAVAGSFGTGTSEYHHPNGSMTTGTPEWYWSGSGPVHYTRRDQLLVSHLSWRSAAAVDYVPELLEGETVEYRGFSSIVSVGLRLVASGHSVTDVQFRVPALRPSFWTDPATSPPTLVHGEASPSGHLLGQVTPMYPGAADVLSGERLVGGVDLVRTDYAWGPSWEAAVYLTRTGVGSAGLAVPVGSLSEASVYYVDLVAQPREYRVVGESPNLTAIISGGRREFIALT